MASGRRRWWDGRERGVWAALVGAILLLGGCSLDSLLKNDELPPDVTDPALTTTPAGALAVYNGAILQFQIAYGGIFGSSFSSGASRLDPNASFVSLAGVFSDELQQPNGSDVTAALPVNTRSLFALGPTTDDPNVEDQFSSMQRTRAQAGQAIALLRTFQPDKPALGGHMYAVEAYAEIMLAELYCSGIPLSTVDYQGNYTVRPGSTTEEVFTHALALLDTGLTLAADSTRFVNLIRVAQGRAQLALGNYVAAATAVAAVPDDYGYALSYGANDNLTTTDGHDERNFAAGWAASSLTQWGGLSVANLEGGNGVDYVTSGDPRTAATQEIYSGFIGYRANKYATDGATPIVLASGTEARLIQAEAALRAGDPSWLTLLNALRTDGAFDVDTQAVSVDNSVTPPDTTFAYDTLWHAGTGGTAGLGPLADPGTDNGRIDLLFRERAFWLFLTGHRQGDMRRLIRQYQRTENNVYPTGPYPISGNLYGTDVTIPIPTLEMTVNPLFTGCASNGA